jgi:hypothetical protein
MPFSAYKFQNLPFSAFCHSTPPPLSIKHLTPLDEHKHICGAETFMEGTLERLPKFSGNVMMLDFS